MRNGFPSSSMSTGDVPAGLYHRPQTLDETLRLLAAAPWTVIAGCTLYYVDGYVRPHLDRLLDITDLDELKGMQVHADRVRLGALTTWTALAGAALPAECAPLQQAARRIGARQIQNVGTIGGNLCGAAANADGIPPLLIADAAVELRSLRRSRTLPLAAFLLGNRQTARQPDEVMSTIILPRRSTPQAGVFLKLARRAYQGLSVATVAARLGTDAGHRIGEAAIAIGACSPVAQRLPTLERRLIGRSIEELRLDLMVDANEDFAPLAPITDTIATAEYRLDVAATLVRRALQTLQGKPQ